MTYRDAKKLYPEAFPPVYDGKLGLLWPIYGDFVIRPNGELVCSTAAGNTWVWYPGNESYWGVET